MTDVLIKLRTARGKQIEILHSLVVGEVGEELLLELRPVATGDDGHLHDAQ